MHILRREKPGDATPTSPHPFLPIQSPPRLSWAPSARSNDGESETRYDGSGLSAGRPVSVETEGGGRKREDAELARSQVDICLVIASV